MRFSRLAAGVAPVVLAAACTRTPSELRHAPPAAAPPACVGDALRPFSPPIDPGGLGVLVTASGEAFSIAGYPFVPGSSRAADPAFVDGWSLHFDHVLVSLDHVMLSAAPDVDPNDELVTGSPVALASGPWAVDLARPSSRAILGRGGAPEKAEPLVALTSQNAGSGGGEAFDAEAKYAFGFETVPAQPCAFDVNLDDEAKGLWTEMVKRGYTTYFVGTATYRGDAACTNAGGFDFGALSRTVFFRLGFASPTAYVNCQNPDLSGEPDSPFEEKPRGVQPKPNAATPAQITIHTDHLFWAKLAHDAPMHFDPFAAAARNGVVTSELLAAMDPNGFTLESGADLPPRSCVADAVPVPGKRMNVDPNGVPQLVTYKDFVTYSQSTQGHLNADGLCAIYRRYPSPR